MIHSTLTTVGLSPDGFAELFPFHVAVNRDLRLVQLGGVLQRLFPGVRAGDPFTEHFDLRPSPEPLHFDGLRKHTRAPVTMRTLDGTLQLKGQFIQDASGGAMVFVGSPWVADLGALGHRGLRLSDFAHHDTRTDYLELLQTLHAQKADLVSTIDELRISHERFELVTHATSDVIWERDLVSGEIEWSDRLSTCFGYALGGAQFDAAAWRKAIHDDDRDRAWRSLEDALAGRGASWSCEYRFQRADGTYAYVLDRGQIVRESGRPVRMVGAMVDLSERQKMQSRLALADRMASLGTLAAGIAHEINNPLTVVSAQHALLADEIETLRAGGQEHGPGVLEARLGSMQDSLREAQSGAGRVQQIVRDLRLFSKADDSERGLVDLRRLLETAGRMASAEIRPRARFVQEIGVLPPVQGNESRLCQVFLDLLVNAAQAIPEGDADRHLVRLSAEERAGRVVIEVSDTGVGISPELQKRIFEPFFTTKPQGVGTGLGLSTCHGIIAALAGTLTCDSIPGRGSVFRVNLPAASPVSHPLLTPVRPMARVPAPGLAANAPISVPGMPSDAGLAPPRRGRILVVDDELAVLNAIRRALSNQHDVVVTGSAREGARIVGGGERFDLILCDLMMPEMTGIDLHAELQAVAPEQAERMLFMTGGAFTPRARTFLETRSRWLEKPFELSTLRAMIRDSLR